MTRATNLVDRITKAFNDHDVDAFAACFAVDGVQRHPFFPEPMYGRAAIRAAEATMFDSFEHVHMEASNVLGEGDLVAAEFRVTAVNTKPIPMPDGTTLPATGRTIDLVMASIMRINVDGEIVEAHRFQDNLAFLRALGIVE